MKRYGVMQTSLKSKYCKESEKRRKIRYKGKFPVELKDVKGMTCDFSSSGIYFETEVVSHFEIIHS